MVTNEFGSSLPRNRAQAEEISLVSIPVEIVPNLYSLEISFISMTLDKLLTNNLILHFKRSLILNMGLRKYEGISNVFLKR
jgi:hypothetical protein